MDWCSHLGKIVMHEFTIITNVLDILKAEAAKYRLKQIRAFTLRLGSLRQCIPDFLKFAFATLAKDTVAAKAQMIIEFIPAKVYCSVCSREFMAEENIFLCPQCDNGDLKLLSGKEIIIESIEGDTDAD